jgi:hypothetical protein
MPLMYNSFRSAWKIKYIVEFKVLTAVVMNVTVFWDIASSSLYVNRRFGGKYNLHLQNRKSAELETRVW